MIECLNKKRKTIRHGSFDYSQNGYYFITICTHKREHLFGEIINENMILNQYGKIIRVELCKTNEIRSNVYIDKFIIMPNHIHFIVKIDKKTNETASVGAYCIRPEPNKIIRPEPNKIIRPEPNKIIHTEQNHPVSPKNKQPTIKHEHFQIMNNVCNTETNRGVCNTPLRGLQSPKNNLGSIIRGFKSTTTKSIRLLNGPYYIWQRNYYEHIIRDDVSLYNICQYIQNNPKMWHRDRNNI